MKFDAYVVGDISMESAKDLCSDLLSKPSKDTSIFLSSEGGDPTAALTIGAAIQHLQRAGKQVHIHVGGLAQSAAVLVVQFANKRTMEPYSSMLVHPIYLPGRAPTEASDAMSISDLHGLADDLCYSEHCYFEVLQRRTGYDIQQLLEKAHYRRTQIMLYPADCLKWNLIDEILDYALPALRQETRIPGDDSLSNVIHLDTTRGHAQIPSSPKARPRKARRA